MTQVQIKQENQYQPWTQPLFMVYDMAANEKVPLTQERLDQLLLCERVYFDMVSGIRREHEHLVRNYGGTPQPWAEIRGQNSDPKP